MVLRLGVDNWRQGDSGKRHLPLKTRKNEEKQTRKSDPSLWEWEREAGDREHIYIYIYNILVRARAFHARSMFDSVLRYLYVYYINIIYIHI